MDTTDEASALHCFEQALEQPEASRAAWLEAQRLSPAVRQRVHRLLSAAGALGDFLDQPAMIAPGADFVFSGERLGPWRLLRQLDAGGMGVVVLAERADEAYQQRVAVKLIRPQPLATPEARQQLVTRFENERALLARLQHPNVARILDGGSTADGIPYLVMEYVDGLPLTDHCNEHALDVPSRLQLFCKVCAGVHEAHRNLIVHRDLKPGNILVGSDGEPRLLDFGIARKLGAPASADSAQGATQLTAMTPAYASPEQLRQQGVTTSSDLYSLGVLLFELLAGRRPYELAGMSPAEAERLVCETEPGRLRQALALAPLNAVERRLRNAQLDGDLERIVAKAMHKDPARRYASAQALAEDLQRHLHGQPVLAHPDSAAYRIGKFIGRHRVGSAAAVLALAAVLVAAMLALWQAGQARRAAEDTQRMNAFLLEVFAMSDPFDAGHELTLSEGLDAAADTLDSRFADRPDLSADLRFGIGYSMLSRYRLDEAEQQLQRALADSEAAFGPDDLRSVRVLEGLAGLRQEQGRSDEAETLFLTCLQRLDASGQQQAPLYVTVTNNLGNFYLSQERFREAEPYLAAARAAMEADPGLRTPMDLPQVISNQAHAAHGLEDYERADGLYRQARERMQALFPQGHPDLAIALSNHASLEEDRGRVEEALALYHQSLAMRRQVLGGDHPLVVNALCAVARVAANLGQLDQALAAAVEAASMSDRVYLEPNSWHITAYRVLGHVQLAHGDHAAALAALEQADAIAATVQAPSPTAMRYLEELRARVCRSQMDAARSPSCPPLPQNQESHA